jgi:hypothetical protein
MEMELVKYKMLAFILALSVTCWAQTTTPSQTPDPGKTPATAAECACCAKTASADQKEGHACMHDKTSAKDAKETASCPSGKDAASCCSGKDRKSCARNDKTAPGCCGSKCGHEMGCCSGKDGKTTAQNCSAGSRCKHDHSDHATPGN